MATLVPGIGIPGIGHHPKDHPGGQPGGGGGGMAPTLKGPLSPRSHMATFRVQSDQAMIRCIQDDTANHHKFFTKPPLRRLLIAIMIPILIVLGEFKRETCLRKTSKVVMRVCI